MRIHEYEGLTPIKCGKGRNLYTYLLPLLALLNQNPGLWTSRMLTLIRREVEQ